MLYQLLFLSNKLLVPSVLDFKTKSSVLQALRPARSPSSARWVIQEKPPKALDLYLWFEECAIQISCSSSGSRVEADNNNHKLLYSHLQAASSPQLYQILN